MPNIHVKTFCISPLKCKTGILPPKNYVYYEDYLECRGATGSLATIVMVVGIAALAALR